LKRGKKVNVTSIYVDKEGDQIHQNRWAGLRKDRSYTVIREFENDDVYVLLTWQGEIPNGANLPSDQWKPFLLSVNNILTQDAHGNIFTCPIRVRDDEATEWFRTEQQALESYEDYLVRHANCEWIPIASSKVSNSSSSDSHFIERGNKLAAPSKNKPDHRVMANPELVGSW
jgi:hypothetical protein